MGINRHKVFISYYHNDDQIYKNEILSQNDLYNLFDDYSVHENEIDDYGMTDEQIRREIRDNYIKNATVLILLCGKNTQKRKHIDWEIHAAMYNSEENAQMGILVINLPTISQKNRATGKDEENIIAPYSNWVPASKELGEVLNDYPYIPDRINENLVRDNVNITIVNWDNISSKPENFRQLIDNAFQRRKTNNYDHSKPLRRRNSN